MKRNTDLLILLSLLSFGFAQKENYNACPKIKSGYYISMDKVIGQKYYALAQINLEGAKEYGDTDLCADVTIDKELKMDWNVRYKSNKEWSIQGNLKLTADERDGLYNITFPSYEKKYEFASRISVLQYSEYIFIYGCQNIDSLFFQESVVVSWFLSKKPYWNPKSIEAFQEEIKDWKLREDDFSMVEQDYDQCILGVTVPPPTSSTEEENSPEVETSPALLPETTQVELTTLSESETSSAAPDVTKTDPAHETSKANSQPTEETKTTQNYQDKYLIPDMQNTWQSLLSLQWSLLLTIVLLVITTIVIGAIVFFVAIPVIRDRQNKAANGLSTTTGSHNLPRYEENEYEKAVP